MPRKQFDDAGNSIPPRPPRPTRPAYVPPTYRPGTGSAYSGAPVPPRPTYPQRPTPAPQRYGSGSAYDGQPIPPRPQALRPQPEPEQEPVPSLPRPDQRPVDAGASTYAGEMPERPQRPRHPALAAMPSMAYESSRHLGAPIANGMAEGTARALDVALPRPPRYRGGESDYNPAQQPYGGTGSAYNPQRQVATAPGAYTDPLSLRGAGEIAGGVAHDALDTYGPALSAGRDALFLAGNVGVNVLRNAPNKYHPERRVPWDDPVIQRGLNFNIPSGRDLMYPALDLLLRGPGVEPSRGTVASMEHFQGDRDAAVQRVQDAYTSAGSNPLTRSGAATDKVGLPGQVLGEAVLAGGLGEAGGISGGPGRIARAGESVYTGLDWTKPITQRLGELPGKVIGQLGPVPTPALAGAPGRPWWEVRPDLQPNVARMAAAEDLPSPIIPLEEPNAIPLGSNGGYDYAQLPNGSVVRKRTGDASGWRFESTAAGWDQNPLKPTLTARDGPRSYADVVRAGQASTAAVPATRGHLQYRGPHDLDAVIVDDNGTVLRAATPQEVAAEKATLADTLRSQRPTFQRPDKIWGFQTPTAEEVNTGVRTSQAGINRTGSVYSGAPVPPRPALPRPIAPAANARLWTDRQRAYLGDLIQQGRYTPEVHARFTQLYPDAALDGTTALSEQAANDLLDLLNGKEPFYAGSPRPTSPASAYAGNAPTSAPVALQRPAVPSSGLDNTILPPIGSVTSGHTISGVSDAELATVATTLRNQSTSVPAGVDAAELLQRVDAEIQRRAARAAARPPIPMNGDLPAWLVDNPAATGTGSAYTGAPTLPRPRRPGGPLYERPMVPGPDDDTLGAFVPATPGENFRGFVVPDDRAPMTTGSAYTGQPQRPRRPGGPPSQRPIVSTPDPVTSAPAPSAPTTSGSSAYSSGRPLPPSAGGPPAGVVAPTKRSMPPWLKSVLIGAGTAATIGAVNQAIFGVGQGYNQLGDQRGNLAVSEDRNFTARTALRYPGGSNQLNADAEKLGGLSHYLPGNQVVWNARAEDAWFASMGYTTPQQRDQAVQAAQQMQTLATRIATAKTPDPTQIAQLAALARQYPELSNHIAWSNYGQDMTGLAPLLSTLGAPAGATNAPTPNAPGALQVPTLSDPPLPGGSPMRQFPDGWRGWDGKQWVPLGQATPTPAAGRATGAAPTIYDPPRAGDSPLRQFPDGWRGWDGKQWTPMSTAPTPTPAYTGADVAAGGAVLDTARNQPLGQQYAGQRRTAYDAVYEYARTHKAWAQDPKTKATFWPGSPSLWEWAKQWPQLRRTYGGGAPAHQNPKQPDGASPAPSGAARPVDAPAATGYGVVVPGARLLSDYGTDRSWSLGPGRTHEGIDLAAPRGTPIYAPEGATVYMTGTEGDPSNVAPLGGNWVQLVTDGDPAHGGARMIYMAHLDAAPTLQPGQHLNAGDLVGPVGNSGDARKTETHLHIQVSKPGGDGSSGWEDPKPYLLALQSAPVHQQVAYAPAVTGRQDASPVGMSTDGLDASTINQIVAGTGLDGQGANIVALSQEYGVPAALALGISRRDSSFDTAGASVDNNNPGNIRRSQYQDSNDGSFAHFPDVATGMRALFWQLGASNLYADAQGRYVDQGDEGVRKAIRTWAPKLDGNDPEAYAADVLAWQRGWQQLARTGSNDAARVQAPPDPSLPDLPPLGGDDDLPPLEALPPDDAPPAGAPVASTPTEDLPPLDALPDIPGATPGGPTHSGWVLEQDPKTGETHYSYYDSATGQYLDAPQGGTEPADMTPQHPGWILYRADDGSVQYGYYTGTEVLASPGDRGGGGGGYGGGRRGGGGGYHYEPADGSSRQVGGSWENYSTAEHRWLPQIKQRSDIPQDIQTLLAMYGAGLVGADRVQSAARLLGLSTDQLLMLWNAPDRWRQLPTLPTLQRF